MMRRHMVGLKVTRIFSAVLFFFLSFFFFPIFFIFSLDFFYFWSTWLYYFMVTQNSFLALSKYLLKYFF